MKISGRQTNYFHTIRFRILLSAVSLILVISTVITFVSYFVVFGNLQKNMIQTAETRLSFLCTSIDANINNVKSFAHSCRNSSKVRAFTEAAEQTGNAVKREAREAITETYTSNSSLPSQLVRLVVMKNFGDEIIQIVESPYSSLTVSAQAIRSLPFYDLLLSHPEELPAGVMQDPFLTTKEVQVIPFLYDIQHPYKADVNGYIFTEMSVSVVTDPIRNYFSETDDCFFLETGEKIYYYSDGKLVSHTASLEPVEDLSRLALSRDTQIWKMRDARDGRILILVTRPLNVRGWYVTECMDSRNLDKTIYRTFFLITLVIIASSSALGIFLSLYLSRTVNVPVKKLQKRMEKIAGGDFSRDASTEWKHELGDIGKNINDLSENVLIQMNQRLEAERQKNDYEYKMLQSQINPHFLYNTLNSIKWMATIQNAPGIAEMTTSLSKLLKDISKGTTTLVSLEHELELIRDYFTIQQYRYGGSITLSIQTEEEALKECRIVKFTLQPIVENAIFHGIEPKGCAGQILIHIYKENSGDVRIDVTDDGIGMPPEVAERILESSTVEKSSFFREIGISNVHKRLQYEFGDAYGLSIASKPGKFTTVSILLPFGGKEKNHD